MKPVRPQSPHTTRCAEGWPGYARPQTCQQTRQQTGRLPLVRRWAGVAALLAACSHPFSAAAQGTWVHTQCLQGAGAAGSCKATPAWGQTGLDHVQALAAAAGPGNLGLSLVKPETLPAANAARAQLAAVMLGYLDGGQPASAYRWFGPVAPATAGGKNTNRPAVNGVVPGAVGPAATPLAAAAAAASGPTSATPGPALHTLSSAWLAGALGDEPQARSASWWLASPYLGLVAPAPVDNGADPYRALRFLAAQCPQLEGKVAPNAWTRCTTHSVPEPGSAALVVLGLLTALAARRLKWRAWMRG